MRYLIFCLLLLLPLNAAFATLETSAKQALVVDFETGTVLLNKDASKQMPTSSMSKVMSMVVVFDALKNGTIKLDDEFTVSEKAWRKGGSKMFVEVNKKVKVEDLIRGVIIQSGNDATIVLAEGLAGSEDAFADKLNDKAAEIGMENSQFKNASGWPDPDHYSTSEDLAKLAEYLITQYPEYYKYYSEKEFEFNDIKQANRNPLLYRDIGADGIKTGHTEAGGYGLMASGVKEGRRVILVVNGLDIEKARASESAKLMEWALNRFENKTLIKAGEKIDTAKVKMGQTETVPLTLKEDLYLTIPKASKKDIQVETKYNGPLIAPITQGDEVGSLSVKIADMDPVEIPLIAGASVEEKGFFGKTLDKAKALIGNM